MCIVHHSYVRHRNIAPVCQLKFSHHPISATTPLNFSTTKPHFRETNLQHKKIVPLSLSLQSILVYNCFTYCTFLLSPVLHLLTPFSCLLSHFSSLMSIVCCLLSLVNFFFWPQMEVPPSTLRFFTVLYNDPAAHQDHCGRCRI